MIEITITICSCHVVDLLFSQVIKESVLGCLLDCLPAGVNRERISSATMKEAYVQKMVKVFNEYDRWSLISLSNNSGKNLELKFVSVLRRQFEFSVDSFQIILDRLLESYMQQESQRKSNTVNVKEQSAESQNKDSPALFKHATGAGTERSSGRDSSGKEGAQVSQSQQADEGHEKKSKVSQQTEQSNQIKYSEVEEEDSKETAPTKLKENCEETDFSDRTPLKAVSEKIQTSGEAEPSTSTELRCEPELTDKTECSAKVEQTEQTELRDGRPPVRSHQKELPSHREQSESPPLPEQTELPRHVEQSELPEPSDKTQTECLKLADQRHSADRSECFRKDQSSDEKDETQQVSAPNLSALSHAAVGMPLADEREVETGTGERAEKDDDIDISEETGEILAAEAKNIEDTQGIDCPCPTSSIALTLHNTQPSDTQDTTDVPSTHHIKSSDKPQDTLDSSPPDTQDILPAPASLVSDKKTSSPPSCKASDRLSHMVVLKHSSPKPPRRMCRKVTPNQYPSPLSDGEPVIAPCQDPDLSPSPEPPLLSDPKLTAPSSDLTTTPTTGVSAETNTGPEPSPHSSRASSPGLTSADPDPTLDISPPSAVDSASTLPQEPSASQPVTEGSVKTSVQNPEETESPSMSLNGRTPSSQTETVLASGQSEPLDSAENFVSHDGTANTPEPEQTSDVELSDRDENGELWTQKSDLNQPNSGTRDAAPISPSSSHCVTPPVSCLTPPALSLSPPYFTPSPPSLSPPPCLTPPSRCFSSPLLSNFSPTTSLSSPPLSFSPTSSCLCSPPYLTPPMLSLSPPPLCLSPPLLCLTPPVESEDLVAQVSPDMEPLVLNTDSEEHFKESSPQTENPDPELEDIKEQDYNSSLPQVAEPASFPITIPSSTSHVLPPTQSGSPGEAGPPKADEASSSVPENKEVPEVTTGMPEQSKSPQASAAVPAVEVLAESMYGDFEAAMDHLRYRLIATRNPEEIRGGGLLKYSNLLVRDYRPASETQIKTLERYMCSRFFIDFPDVQEQQRKILSYLKNHFIGEERSKYQYLMTLRRVVDDSTVCLMGHERRQTLNMITVLALKVLGEQNIIPNTDHVTCFYQPAPYLAEHSAPYLAEPSYCSYYIPQGGSTLLYQPYPLHLHTQTGLV